MLKEPSRFTGRVDNKVDFKLGRLCTTAVRTARRLFLLFTFPSVRTAVASCVMNDGKQASYSSHQS